MNTRPKLTVAQAVAAFDVTRRTLQRRLAAGELDGAAKDNAGHWSIPIEALHALGCGARKNVPQDTTRATNGATKSGETFPQKEYQLTPNSAPEIASLRAILHDTQQQLEAERRLREAAERNSEDLRTAMRMLESTSEKTTTAEPPTRRRWWQL